MNSKIKKSPLSEQSPEDSEAQEGNNKTNEISKSKPLINDKTKERLDENLLTLNKVHGILLNCINLNKIQ